MAKTPADPKTAPPTFETAITRLETLVEQMDSKNLPLQELITHYEEGIRLVKVCEERLNEAEKRIEIITRDAAGAPRVEEFEPAIPPTTNPGASRGEVSLF